MVDLVLTALFLALPLLVSGCYHMLVVRKNHFAALAIPLHTRWFGPNKTWRGILVMLLATIPGVWLAQVIEPWFGGRLVTSLSGQNPVWQYMSSLRYVGARREFFQEAEAGDARPAFWAIRTPAAPATRTPAR